ncbi:MAG: hypothetical protein GAK28_00905 [Luteibacter sp.]|uniref:DUF4386 domain-containing protein n=1 Tax=Luteibacter sp. TaxID=1886636 RepID=UPI00138184B5|nr:DUF4386 domain-containing protein [Luteibacter sp.]KAF1008484.1 MAG: hypothetical protein GAK28_00905 [Luteibacter sp.]
MHPSSRQARIAGSLFLLLILVAPIRLIYIPDTLFVGGDPAATARNIAEQATLFRLGIVADMAAGLLMIFITLALRRLLLSVDEGMSRAVVILGGVLPAALYFANTVNDAAALTLIHAPPYLDAFSQAQREALALFFLRLHGQTVYAAEMFWGAWLLPLALLVYRSGFLPRLLGAWLFVNGLAYIAQSVVAFLAPSCLDSLSDICSPIQFGEIAFTLWLLLMGVKPRANPL